MEFRDILRDLIIDRNVNQTEVARLVKVKQSQVSQGLGGKSNPSFVTLKAICKALDISGDEILGLK